ncbi:MAG: hypothetical protein WB988_01455, partial [Candidatus Nitrosopolaris sp.]
SFFYNFSAYEDVKTVALSIFFLYLICLSLLILIMDFLQLLQLNPVEFPASVFDSRLDSYEEYVDLDSLQSVTLDWARCS